MKGAEVISQDTQWSGHASTGEILEADLSLVHPCSPSSHLVMQKIATCMAQRWELAQFMGVTEGECCQGQLMRRGVLDERTARGEIDHVRHS